MIKLFEKLHAFSPLTPACKDHLQYYLHRKELVKGDHFICLGDTHTRCAFVEEGCLRSYAYRMQEDMTLGFFAPGDICMVADSFFWRHHSSRCIQAIERTVIYELDYANFRQMCHAHLDFRDLTDKLVLKNFIFTETMYFSSQVYTPRYRYDYFKEKYVHESPAVRRYLASCLGLTRDVIKVFETMDRRSAKEEKAERRGE